MALDYRKCAEEISANIGGGSNVISAAHCATRLRLVIADNGKVNKAALENVDGVKGMFESNGQLQLIIGTGTVNKVYEEFLSVAGVSAASKDDVTLIADLGDAEQSQVPYGRLVGGRYGPGVHQRGMHHHDTDDAAQEDVPAEDPRRGNRDQHRQQREGGVGHHIQEAEPSAVREGGNRLGQRFHKAHHQTGGHDGGQDRNKHIAGRLQDFLPQGHLGSRGFLDVILGRRGYARD